MLAFHLFWVDFSQVQAYLRKDITYSQVIWAVNNSLFFKVSSRNRKKMKATQSEVYDKLCCQFLTEGTGPNILYIDLISI